MKEIMPKVRDQDRCAAQASLARTPNAALSGSLVAFSLVGFIPIATLRASPGSPGPGKICALVYGVATVNAVTAWPARTLWHQVRHKIRFAVQSKIVIIGTQAS